MTTKTAFRIENGVKFVKMRGYLLIKSIVNALNANAKEFTLGLFVLFGDAMRPSPN